VVLELRTARANHIPHSTLRSGSKPTRWTVKDRLLALALTVHEDGLCRGCGHPKDRSWNEDMEGEYQAHRVLCQACQAMHLATDGHPLSPAETAFVLDITPDGYDPDPRMAPRFDTPNAPPSAVRAPVRESSIAG